MVIERRGMMFVLSSPSGAGKSTLAKGLLEADQLIELSVSVTTRAPRPGEQNGREYHFRSVEAFEAMVRDGALLEYAEVFGNRYGTPRAPVEEALASGRDVLFDIDWQGAQQLERNALNDLVRVFILPPSWTELETRLRNRASDPEDVVARRMAQAGTEMSHWAEYDYVIVNRDRTEALGQVCAILTAERLRRQRQIGLTDFVAKLRTGSDAVEPHSP
ncbi:MAG: guanylate kinase [Alphaproteobacteria bacterium]